MRTAVKRVAQNANISLNSHTVALGEPAVKRKKERKIIRGNGGDVDRHDVVL